MFLGNSARIDYIELLSAFGNTIVIYLCALIETSRILFSYSDNRRTECGYPIIPCIESIFKSGVAGDILQQRITVLKCLIVFKKCAAKSRLYLADSSVDKAPSLSGTPFYKRQMLRRKHNGTKLTEQSRCSRLLDTIQKGFLFSLCVNDLCRLLSALREKGRANPCKFSAEANKLAVL